MREIKFRAWHEKQERMYSAEEMGQDQLTLMPDGRGLANISGADTKLSRVDDGRTMIPLQYTGLKDKQGKEIYEGDIVQTMQEDEQKAYIEQVKWSEDFLCWAVYQNNEFAELYLSAGNSEVIGNIYENPELLEIK